MKLLKSNRDVIIETAHKTVKETVLYCIENKIDLRGANLFEADLRGANLSWANLRGADLRGADLRGANLSWANLRGADLFEADLRGANLFEADLREADLYKADLREADLREADLYNADLRWAKNIFIFNKENGRTCYAVRHNIGLMIKAGCFWGTLVEFESKCLAEYPNDSVQAYAAQITYLKTL